jgi:hypothetical protein
MKITDAKDNIKLHRAHRIGKYRSDKQRPIVAKFAFFPDREKVRINSKSLENPYWVSEQYTKEVLENRRRLIPIMVKASEENKEEFLRGDKL